MQTKECCTKPSYIESSNAKNIYCTNCGNVKNLDNEPTEIVEKVIEKHHHHYYEHYCYRPNWYGYWNGYPYTHTYTTPLQVYNGQQTITSTLGSVSNGSGQLTSGYVSATMNTVSNAMNDKAIALNS